MPKLQLFTISNHTRYFSYFFFFFFLFFGLVDISCFYVTHAGFPKRTILSRWPGTHIPSTSFQPFPTWTFYIQNTCFIWENRHLKLFLLITFWLAGENSNRKKKCVYTFRCIWAQKKKKLFRFNCNLNHKLKVHL